MIPETYILDQGRSFTLPPIGISSSTLSMIAKVHTLPNKIPYQTALNSGEINVKRLVVAPFAAAKLLASYSDIPTDYILDIGPYLCGKPSASPLEILTKESSP